MHPTDIDYDRMLSLLSAERLDSYMRACQGDQVAAFSLYEWNIEASAAAVSLTAMVEVVLRNALDRRMVEWRPRVEAVTGSHLRLSTSEDGPTYAVRENGPAGPVEELPTGR